MINLFGTDGIRGKVNDYPLTADFFVKLGIAISHYYKSEHGNSPKIIIGKDTRLSGYMLQSSLEAGILSTGGNVELVGPISTAGIAILTKKLKGNCGVMITASHNLYYDNGIKIFDKYGKKISNDDQYHISKIIDDIKQNSHLYLEVPNKIGKARYCAEAYSIYIEHIVSRLPDDFEIGNKTIVFDIAHGAVHRIIKKFISKLNLQNIIIINDEPNGLNINLDSGATNTTQLKKAVLKYNADIGFAFDGDADRLVVVDEKGNEVNGNQCVAALIINAYKYNLIKEKKAVLTKWSSMFLLKYLKSIGYTIFESDVGDRNIIYTMNKNYIEIGGEPSGHYIFDKTNIPTCDSMFTALWMAYFFNKSKKQSSEFFNLFDIPDIYTHNFYNITSEIEKSESFIKYINSINKEIGENGRVLFRKSGTEKNCIRVMIESAQNKNIKKYMMQITKKIQSMQMK